jgi:hypothetical protein
MTIAPERTVTGQDFLEEAPRLPGEPPPFKLHERGARETIKVVEMVTDDPLSALVGHTDPVYGVAFSPRCADPGLGVG